MLSASTLAKGMAVMALVLQVVSEITHLSERTSCYKYSQDQGQSWCL